METQKLPLYKPLFRLLDSEMRMKKHLPRFEHFTIGQEIVLTNEHGRKDTKLSPAFMKWMGSSF
ncbi:MAG: hypothetical protein K5854_04390 [Prevotella sp.]|jgi:hypothetical protein|nr:hypothetical protein [Prevotella sp.]